MKIENIYSASNKVTQVTSAGSSAPICLSSAWNFTSVTEDIFLESQNRSFNPFVIIPLSAGTISVQLEGGMNYVISEAEVTANLGKILPYSVKRIYKAGTTVTALSVGI